MLWGDPSHPERKPGVPQGSAGALSSFTLFIIIRQLVIAAPWGLEPKKELG